MAEILPIWRKTLFNQSIMKVNPWVYLGGRFRRWWPRLWGQRPHRVYRRPPPPSHRSWCPYIDLYNDTTYTFSKDSREQSNFCPQVWWRNPVKKLPKAELQGQMQQISRASLHTGGYLIHCSQIARRHEIVTLLYGLRYNFYRNKEVCDVNNILINWSLEYHNKALNGPLHTQNCTTAVFGVWTWQTNTSNFLFISFSFLLCHIWQ